MTDLDRSPAEPLPKDVIRRQGDHVYVSTACHHGLHPRCRDTCKFCDTPCRCHCHKGAEECAHEDTVFDRIPCPEPCGCMHTYCTRCRRAVEPPCAFGDLMPSEG